MDCGTLSFRCTGRFLPLVVDLVQSSECVDNNNTSPGVFFRVCFFFVLFALPMILCFNRGVPDLSRFMVDFQSLFEVV